MTKLPVLRNFFNEDLFEIDSLMDAFLAPAIKDVCKINMKEREKDFVIVAATPGIDKENLSIEYDNGFLSIRGISKEDIKKDNDKYIYRELNLSNFYRSFRVDEKNIAIDEIKSTYENGILKIILPKKTPEKRNGKRILIE